MLIGVADPDAFATRKSYYHKVLTFIEEAATDLQSLSSELSDDQKDQEQRDALRNLENIGREFTKMQQTVKDRKKKLESDEATAKRQRKDKDETKFTKRELELIKALDVSSPSGSGSAAAGDQQQQAASAYLMRRKVELRRKEFHEYVKHREGGSPMSMFSVCLTVLLV